MMGVELNQLILRGNNLFLDSKFLITVSSWKPIDLTFSGGQHLLLSENEITDLRLIVLTEANKPFWIEDSNVSRVYIFQTPFLFWVESIQNQLYVNNTSSTELVLKFFCFYRQEEVPEILYEFESKML